MSTAYIREQVENSQNNLTLALYNYGEEVPHVDSAIEIGTATIPVLQVAAEGITAYLAQTKLAWTAGMVMRARQEEAHNVLDTSPVGSEIQAKAEEWLLEARRESKEAVENRDWAIESGRNVIDAVGKAVTDMTRYMHASDEAHNCASAAGEFISNAEVTLKNAGITPDDKGIGGIMMQKIITAHWTAGGYTNQLAFAKDHIKDELGDEAPGERIDVNELNSLIDRLTEGVNLLQGSVGKPAGEFIDAQEAAGTKASETDGIYLTFLAQAMQNGIDAHKACSEQRGSIEDLVRSAHDDGKNFLANL